MEGTDENQLSIEVRFSQLRRIAEEKEDDVADSHGNGSVAGLQSNSQTQRCDSDSGVSDISTENGDALTQVLRKNASTLETLLEKSDDYNSKYGTFMSQDNKSDSPLTYIASNTHDNCNDDDDKDDKSDNKEETTEQKFSFKTLTRPQKVILASTSFTNLLSYLSLSILAPFFPKEANEKDVNETISGWIFGAFALTQFLTSPLFGKLIPYVGSKFMYVAGIFMCGGCTILFGFLDLVETNDGIWTFVSLSFIVRIFLAIGCTSLNNAGFVMLLKAFPNDIATVFNKPLRWLFRVPTINVETKTAKLRNDVKNFKFTATTWIPEPIPMRSMGIGEIFTGVGMVTGPAIGGFLYAAGGFITPFAVIGVMCFLALPLIWYTVPPQDDTVTEKSDLPVSRLIFNPKSLVNSLSITVAAAIWAILDPTLEPHLRVYGLSAELVGILFLVMAAFYSVASPVWGWLADRISDNRVLLVPGFILAAVGLLLLGPSPLIGFDISFNEIWLTIVSLVILGIASALCIIPTYDIYLDVLEEIEYPDDTRTFGMVSGLWVSMYALGDFAGPSLGGFLYQEAGFEWMATYTAGLCLFTSVVVLFSWLVSKHCKYCRKKLRAKDPEKTPIVEDTEASMVESFPSYNLADDKHSGY